jgi:drug/metabolite transporter (DMT)-like permease
MPGYVVAAVLLGALFHASWNAMVKSGRDSYLNTVMVALGGMLLSAFALPFLPAPSQASWIYIGVSSAVQVVYYMLLAATYRDGDMSHAYPLMRGSAPLLVGIASLPLMGEALRPMQWLSIVVICSGIFIMYFSAGRQPHAGRTTLLALSTAMMIAAYTLIDGAGVRLSGSALSYSMWIFMLTGAGFWIVAARERPGEIVAYAKANPRILILGGIGTIGSYTIALWAMTKAPVAAVAALRETSILFATGIAVFVLKEKIARSRLAAVAVIAIGAACMRLA